MESQKKESSARYGVRSLKSYIIDKLQEYTPQDLLSEEQIKEIYADYKPLYKRLPEFCKAKMPDIISATFGQYILAGRNVWERSQRSLEVLDSLEKHNHNGQSDLGQTISKVTIKKYEEFI